MRRERERDLWQNKGQRVDDESHILYTIRFYSTFFLRLSDVCAKSFPRRFPLSVAVFSFLIQTLSFVAVVGGDDNDDVRCQKMAVPSAQMSMSRRVSFHHH